jgi:hypothetical protein
MSSLTPHLAADRRAREDGGRPPGTLGLRMRVLLRKNRLDRMLAEGADPAQSAELALRAAQLTSDAHRRSLADGFDEVLSIAEGHGPHRRCAAPPIAHHDVRASRAALLQLSRALRYDPAVRPSGVARAKRLLTDGNGPLYVESADDALWHALRGATAALDGHA